MAFKKIGSPEPTLSVRNPQTGMVVTSCSKCGCNTGSAIIKTASATSTPATCAACSKAA